ncbi:hypothetical protein EMIHUDRAFT_241416 [Emiliania huxleyi CCMP1516]|uniref:Autophagy-related protein 9 n=2 Tax=Emiliania huxleyi TaxID=2903 RepID=A0A0D3JCQ5_EMIH1|nr:hypothetical protein EMIHUDRAFT_241416 [Emiliania huxleyi CCMP1516]EOD21290.1 hypothetical protein EMIHUDRAFT_241416 [Emiliania huxleyi CCMP1516]|eukprot:XP_005773719.1 hypothetical protein EMIHUDRAFT_241416 [Emiliania huxleyi CCMP1516]
MARFLQREGALKFFFNALKFFFALVPCLGEPTPLQRAAGGEGEAAALIRRAAAPWSPASHSLFPAPARECAVMVMRIGYQIAFSPPDDAEARPDRSALSDVWREHVLPHAVAR